MERFLSSRNFQIWESYISMGQGEGLQAWGLTVSLLNHIICCFSYRKNAKPAK